MLLSQTQHDRKETRARHSVRALNKKHTLEFVFIECYAMLCFSTYKMAPQTHAKQCLFVQLKKWSMCPLVLIYNSMPPTHHWILMTCDRLLFTPMSKYPVPPSDPIGHQEPLALNLELYTF